MEGYPQRFVVFRAEWIDKISSVGVHWRTEREFDRIPGLLASVALGDHLACLALSDMLQDIDAPKWVYLAVAGDPDWWADLPPDDGQRDRDSELIEQINALPLARRVRVAREIEGVRVGLVTFDEPTELDHRGDAVGPNDYRSAFDSSRRTPHIIDDSRRTTTTLISNCVGRMSDVELRHLLESLVSYERDREVGRDRRFIEQEQARAAFQSGVITSSEYIRLMGFDPPVNPHPPTAPTRPDTPR
jgi:hypothetical protein